MVLSNVDAPLSAQAEYCEEYQILVIFKGVQKICERFPKKGMIQHDHDKI